jgi:hypothetical protein
VDGSTTFIVHLIELVKIVDPILSFLGSGLRKPPMDMVQAPAIEPSKDGSRRVGTFGESQLRPVLVGALTAVVVSGTLVTLVAAIGTTVAQVAAVVATANTESAARHVPAHASTSCGLASR